MTEREIAIIKAEARREILKDVSEMLEEFRLSWTDPAEFDRRQDKRDYEEAKKQIEAMRPITFGSPVNVLLLTDRLHGCAKGLLEYLGNSTDITVNLVNDLEGVLRTAKPIDFLLIVGMQRDHNNYASMQAVRGFNPFVHVIMYAHLDHVIREICAENGIRCSFDRRLPMDCLVTYMRSFLQYGE